MTRLFLRFYFGVLVILITAWFIQAYVYRGRLPEADIKVIENALAGGARLARDEIMVQGRDGLPESLERVQNRFDYPVGIVPLSERPMSDIAMAKLSRGDASLYFDKLHVLLPKTELILEFGPLPKFASPTQTDVTVGIGSVFIMSAIAIAILLRPVVRQLRDAETIALAIADGDLSARIDRPNHKRLLPISSAFNVMATRVETLLGNQTELLQAVSHELRTPLSRIQFATELLRSAKDESQRNQRIVAIEDATDHLNELVGELLDYVRMDAGTPRSDWEAISVEALFGDLIATHDSMHDAVVFESHIDESTAVIVSHRQGLSRAMGNLVGNAAKFSQGKVRLSSQRVGDSVQLIVDDDGPGVAESDRERIFKPFTRIGDADVPGTGLGLTLVRRIVGRLGGQIFVDESTLGGARFKIELPCAEPPNA